MTVVKVQDDLSAAVIDYERETVVAATVFGPWLVWAWFVAGAVLLCVRGDSDLVALGLVGILLIGMLVGGNRTALSATGDRILYRCYWSIGGTMVYPIATTVIRHADVERIETRRLSNRRSKRGLVVITSATAEIQMHCKDPESVAATLRACGDPPEDASPSTAVEPLQSLPS